MPGRFELKSTLEKIWHAPDHFRLMDPLPPMHRRGIIAGALLVVIGVLLPSEDNGSSVQASREAISTCNLSRSRSLQVIRPSHCRPSPTRRRSTMPIRWRRSRRSPFRMSSRINRSSRPLPSLIRSRSRLPALSSSGGPTVLNPAKPSRSCSATTTCRRPTFTPWPRLKVPVSR